MDEPKVDDVEKVDLQPLLPSVERFSAMMAAVVERARSRSIAAQMVAFARPTLAIAAALVLVVWTAAFLRRPAPEPVELLSQWAASDEVPSTATILEAFGDNHGAE